MNAVERAEELNRRCLCESRPQSPSGFLSGVPVFVAPEQVRFMRSVIEAVCTVVALPGYLSAVLRTAPALAGIPQATLGVFTAFDFHVLGAQPQLIEINTNAGGALLNAAAQWRHPDCCGETEGRVQTPPTRAQLEQAFLEMFRAEWRRARGDRPLRRIAIVDEAPARQFLYPEFQLFAALFEAAGLSCVIADAAGLRFAEGQLWHGEQPIDLVYNRVTDFYFESPSSAALRQAYEADAAVITPHPRAHALLADKRNLVRFTDADFLRGVGASSQVIDTLRAGIPRTREVLGDATRWWAERSEWFFKPVSGFGSRGAYRGDKLTRRVFEEIMAGGYVAQAYAAPGQRWRRGRGKPAGDEAAVPLKVDLRCYVYADSLQLMAARLYRGQTTNFRTEGGGFSPVLELRDV